MIKIIAFVLHILWSSYMTYTIYMLVFIEVKILFHRPKTLAQNLFYRSQIVHKILIHLNLEQRNINKELDCCPIKISMEKTIKIKIKNNSTQIGPKSRGYLDITEIILRY